jgi:hypothetical protein
MLLPTILTKGCMFSLLFASCLSANHGSLVTANDIMKNAIPIPNQSSCAYRPRALRPEACQHLTDEACQEMDDRFYQHQERTLQTAADSGSVKMLVILMRWSDHGNKNLPSPDDYRTMFSAATGVTDGNIIPGGSISSYVDTQTYGKLELDVTVTDWMTTDNTETYYAAGRKGTPSNSGPDLTTAVTDVLQQMDDNGFDFM